MVGVLPHKIKGLWQIIAPDMASAGAGARITDRTPALFHKGQRAPAGTIDLSAAGTVAAFR
jgi:hypothetical protein